MVENEHNKILGGAAPIMWVALFCINRNVTIVLGLPGGRCLLLVAEGFRNAYILYHISAQMSHGGLI